MASPSSRCPGEPSCFPGVGLDVLRTEAAWSKQLGGCVPVLATLSLTLQTWPLTPVPAGWCSRTVV